MIIGLTGKRHVGKSEAAGFLVEAGFRRAHAFEGGKVASAAYFMHLGASAEVAERMVYSDLKDVPSDLLPRRATPRFWMEEFGKFMGVHMGAEWTLGSELGRLQRQHPHEDLVVESIVYEAKQLREAGGIIVRIIRPGDSGIAGQNTDAAEAAIEADATIFNDGTLDDLKRKVLDLAA